MQLIGASTLDYFKIKGRTDIGEEVRRVERILCLFFANLSSLSKKVNRLIVWLRCRLAE